LTAGRDPGRIAEHQARQAHAGAHKSVLLEQNFRLTGPARPVSRALKAFALRGGER
jgi:hypothetical protein